MTKIEKFNISGCLVSNVDLNDTVNIFNQIIDIGEKYRVCVTPVNCIVWANQNKELQQVYNSADLTLCDGVPVIWASKFLGTPLKGRVTGLDLFPIYIEEIYRRNYTFFLLGAKEGVGEKLRQLFEKKYPGIQLKGVYSPPFAEKFSDKENIKIIELINRVKPNILWVSLTAPKQDYWIFENFNKLDVNIAIGVGGAFEVAAGMIDRSPLWMQRMGLEWFYRFSKEPRRLFKRYFIEAPMFFKYIFKQKYK